MASGVPAPPEHADWPAELGRLAPDIAARLGRDQPPPPVSSPELERLRVFDAVLHLVEWTAAARPVLLVAEDVHRADVDPGADRGPGPGVLRAPGQLRDQAGLADPGLAGAQRTVRWTILGADRDLAGHYVAVVEFPGYAEAMANSDHPATAAFLKELQAISTSEPRFRNLDVRSVPAY